MESWSDAWLTTAIESALVNEPGLDGTHIEVESRQGVVTLRGVVHTAAQLARAEYVARGFGGVLGLRNELQTTP